MTKQIKLEEVKASVAGRWFEVLAALGVPAETLTSKHKPCPACGGHDRFSYLDGDNGRFVCRHHDNQGGDGFALLQHYYGYDFKDALKAVAGVLGLGDVTASPMPIKRPQADNKPIKDRLFALQRLWGDGEAVKADCPVLDYLHGRGLSEPCLSADVVRYYPNLQYWHDGACLGSFPAMVAAIKDTSDQLQGLHLTYLQATYGKPMGDDGYHGPEFTKLELTIQTTGEVVTAKKIRNRFSGSLKGAAIQLFQPQNGRLAVTEGIETALAVREINGLPVWACMSAWGMESLELPEGVTELFIFADNDANQAGYKAGARLMMRAIKSGIKARLWTPDYVGQDALDLLAEVKSIKGVA